MLDLRDRLTIFKDLKNPNYWSGAFRGPPAKLRPEDGEVLVAAIREAQANPVKLPVNKHKLARRPSGYKSTVGIVTVPSDEEELAGPPDPHLESALGTKEPTAHTEIQWLLLKLGSDMGLDVWAARSDRNREWNGRRFDSLPQALMSYPANSMKRHTGSLKTLTSSGSEAMRLLPPSRLRALRRCTQDSSG